MIGKEARESGWTKGGKRVALGALVLFLAATAEAQSGRIRYARYSKPLRSLTIDVGTGTVTRGATVRDRGADTVVDFSNLDLGGFTGLDTGGGFCEWFEAGVKGTGMGPTAGVMNDSDLMNSIVFAYCSAALTPGSGGPGGSVKLGFYEGYTQFGGAPTTTVAVLTLTGLPGNTRSSSFFGGFDCYFVRVVFPTLVCFADGPIGYSWKFLDLGTGLVNPLGATLAATWPFLACIASCSGVVLPCGVPNSQGVAAPIDRYCPPGNLIVPTFCFATASGQFQSIGMAIEEVVDLPATIATFNSTTFPNPDFLDAPPAAVGQTWSPSLTLGLTRTKGSGTWLVYFGAAKVNPPSGVPIPPASAGLNFGTNKAGRMLLCAFDTLGAFCTGTHTGASGSVSAAACGGPIPKKVGLVCNPWCAQALVLGPVGAADGGGNVRISSGIGGTVGTH